MMRKVIRRCSTAFAVSIILSSCDSQRPLSPEPAQATRPSSDAENLRPIVRPVPPGVTLPVSATWNSAIVSERRTFFTLPSAFATPTASGTPSLIWLASDGSATIWKMNGAVWSGAGATVLTIPSPWKLVATGDLNGDGHPDFIWEATDGTRAVTFMNGAAYGGSYAMMFQFSPNWKIVGATDFNSDGKPDLVLANTVSGANGVLYLNGTAWTGVFATLPGQYPMLPVAVADMDGDSQPDLVLQGQSSGVPSVSLFKVMELDGLTARPSGGIFTAPPEWRIGTAADFNDDGRADVVLQNINDGRRKILFMNGYQPSGDSTALPTVSTANMVVSAAAIQYPVAPLNMTLSNFYLTQGIQDLARSVPLIAGRSAVARVFVTANDYNSASPVVRVRITQIGGSFTDFTAIRPATSGLPLSVSESSLRGSFNVTIPGSQIVAGASVSITVDPANAIAETNEGDNSVSAPLTVRTGARFDVRFVPVRLTGGETGNVTLSNVPAYMSVAMKIWPLTSYDADIHATFNSAQSSISTYEGLTAVVNEILNLRTVEGGTRYYYGALPIPSQAQYAGVGYLGLPAAVGFNVSSATDTTSTISAHEWGHNFNRPHAPGCNAGDPDPNYPDPTGHIDSYGYNPSVISPPSPAQYYDIMSYCGPVWVSGYNFKNVFNFVAPFGSNARAPLPARTPSLIVWGRISDQGEIVLEPSFQVTTIPQMPEGEGRYAIEGRDENGNLLFSFKFDGYELGDGRAGERHFSYAIPLSMFDSKRLTVLKVVRSDVKTVVDRRAIRTSLAAANPPETKETLSSIAGGAELKWNAVAYPLVVVRDAATGEVISFARNGSARLALKGTRQLELIFADGVRSMSKTIAVSN